MTKSAVLPRVSALLLLAAMLLAGCTGPGGTPSGTGGPTPTAAASPAPEVIDHDASLSLMGIWSPITATHGNPFIAGFPLHPSIYCWDAPFDVQAFDAASPFAPLLAEGYTIDEATRVLTMTMKPGITWSDGVPITMEDVRANLALQLNKNYVWDFIESMRIVDDRSFEVTFSRYNIILLSKVLNNAISMRYTDYKEHVDRLYDIIENDRYFDEAAGRWRVTTEGGKKYVRFNGLLGKVKPNLVEIPVTGPFRFTSVSNDEIIMERVDSYWNASQVHFKTLRFHKVTSTENTVLLTKAGKLDMDGTSVTPEITTQLELLFPEMRTLLKPIANQMGLAFNFEQYPMNLPEVRKAISMAIDRSILLDVRKPMARPGDPYNSGIARLTQDKGTYTDKAFMSALRSYDYDPAGAAALLESIGWSRDGGQWANERGETVRLEINSGGIVIEAEICRDLLADFGFDADYVPVDANVMWANMEQSKHMIFFGLVAASIFEFPDPWSSYNCTYYYPLSRIHASLRLAEGEPFAITDAAGVSHDVGKIIGDLRSASTDAELRALTHEMAKLTNELCPFATLYEETDILRIYDPTIRYILEGYDNVSKMVVYDDYSQLRGGPGWSMRMGRLYKVRP